MSQKKDWELTEAEWNRLLDWLDTDRERAAARYQQLHRRLTVFFCNRGCNSAEELADETLNRAIRRLPKLQDEFEGDPARYLYAIARHLYVEHIQERQRQVPLSTPQQEAWLAPPTAEQSEREAECLESCLQQLPELQQRLILTYYQDEKRSKIERRKQLAAELELSATALRLRAHRIREVLEQCLENCLESKETS